MGPFFLFKYHRQTLTTFWRHQKNNDCSKIAGRPDRDE